MTNLHPFFARARLIKRKSGRWCVRSMQGAIFPSHGKGVGAGECLLLNPIFVGDDNIEIIVAISQSPGIGEACQSRSLGNQRPWPIGGGGLVDLVAVHRANCGWCADHVRPRFVRTTIPGRPFLSTCLLQEGSWRERPCTWAFLSSAIRRQSHGLPAS